MLHILKWIPSLVLCCGKSKWIEFFLFSENGDKISVTLNATSHSIYHHAGENILFVVPVPRMLCYSVNMKINNEKTKSRTSSDYTANIKR